MKDLITATRGRLLTIVHLGDLPQAIRGMGEPLVALLSSNAVDEAPLALRPSVDALLDAGCDYFVCAGLKSEALHDTVDDRIVDREAPARAAIITTWHDDETSTEIAAFFNEVAGAREGTFMVAALGDLDDGLARALVRHSTRPLADE